MDQSHIKLFKRYCNSTFKHGGYNLHILGKTNYIQKNVISKARIFFANISNTLITYR